MADRRARPVVLVHGAWIGVWCFAALQSELDRRGVPSYAVGLPGRFPDGGDLGDLHTDATHVAAAVERLDSDVVLVGHSYGGAVVAEAVEHVTRVDGVAHVVFIAGFALAAGESVNGYLREQPRALFALAEALVIGDDGETTTLDPSRSRAALCGDAEPLTAAAVGRRLGPQSVASMRQPTTGDRWRRIPSTYLLCTRDESVHPTHQAPLAARCHRTVTLDADHCPFLSQPTAVADVLAPLATAP